MNIKSEQIFEEIIKQTEKLYSLLNDGFLSFTKNHPKIMDELHQSFRNSRDQVYCLNQVDSDLQGCEVDNSMEKILSSMSKYLDDTKNIFATMESQNNRLLDTIKNAIGHLSSLDSHIVQIREDSMEMELVSLNAMTVAIKTGTEGRAFSYITEELKRLSTKIVSLTSEVTAEGSTLLQDFYSFQNEINTTSQGYEDVFNSMGNRLEDSFDNFFIAIDTITSSFQELAASVRKMETPLYKTIEESQKQDKIRHIIGAIEGMIEHFDSIILFDHGDEYIDGLVFLIQLCTIIRSIIRKSNSITQKSYKKLKFGIDGVIQSFEEVEQTRKQLLFTISQTNDVSLNIQKNFQDAEAVFQDIISQVQFALNSKTSSVQRSLDLTNNVKTLDSRFKLFTSLVSRLQTIDVASRIEINKTAELEQMTGTIDKMTSLTSKIKQDVTISYESTQDFLRQTQEVIFSLRDDFETEVRNIKKLEIKILREFTKIVENKELLLNDVRNFRLFDDSFFETVRNTKRELLELAKLPDQMEDIDKFLEEVIQSSEDKLRTVYNINPNTWIIQNFQMNTFLDRIGFFLNTDQLDPIQN
jgi:hypothetical protein